MKILITLATTIILLASTLFNHSCFGVKPETSYALINPDIWILAVGINDYHNARYDSKYGADDAELLCESLSAFVPEDRILLLKNDYATKEGINSAIKEWISPRETDRSAVFFYFSGHSNSEYLCTYNSVVGSRQNDISVVELSSILLQLESKDVVLVLDCCNSFDYATKLGLSNATIITGCSSGQSCWESEVIRHGVFSYSLITAINNRKHTDINQDDILSAEELYAYAGNFMKTIFSTAPPPSPKVAQIIKLNGTSKQILIKRQYISR